MCVVKSRGSVELILLRSANKSESVLAARMFRQRVYSKMSTFEGVKWIRNQAYNHNWVAVCAIVLLAIRCAQVAQMGCIGIVVVPDVEHTCTTPCSRTPCTRKLVFRLISLPEDEIVVTVKNRYIFIISPEVESIEALVPRRIVSPQGQAKTAFSTSPPV